MSGKLWEPDEIAALPGRDAYTLFKFGWALELQPQFDTPRTQLLIHADGNVPGTLGCIGLQFKNLNDNISCYRMIKNGIEQGKLQIEVIEKLTDPRGKVIA